MPKNPLKLKIGYLYPDIMQSSCDRANIDVFLKRAKWRGIDVEVCEIKANDRILPSFYHNFYYLGGSNKEMMSYCTKHLNQNKDVLKAAVAMMVPMLAVNCGYQMVGNYYQLHNNTQIKGIGLLNVNTTEGKDLKYGNVIGNCKFLKRKTIVGFENHATETYLIGDTMPFLTLNSGFGNNKR